VLTKSGVVAEACVPYAPMGASGGPKACAWQQPCMPAFPVQGGFQVTQLATVAQMQAHIVEHGVVVTALTVYMDYLKHWASGSEEAYRWARAGGPGARLAALRPLAAAAGTGRAAGVCPALRCAAGRGCWAGLLGGSAALRGRAGPGG
jgi:hypothetical protein